VQKSYSIGMAKNGAAWEKIQPAYRSATGPTNPEREPTETTTWSSKNSHLTQKIAGRWLSILFFTQVGKVVSTYDLNDTGQFLGTESISGARGERFNESSRGARRYQGFSVFKFLPIT
jgi:hypothetical protein